MFVAGLVAWLLGIATVVGGVAGALFFLPRVGVSVSGVADPANPFSVSFTITNTSIFPLRDVGASFALIELVGGPLPFNELKRPALPSDRLTEFTYREWSNHNLAMDESYTITPHGLIGPARPGVTLAGADVAIVVNYRPWPVPFKRRRVFRFVSHRYNNGTYSWYSYPLR